MASSTSEAERPSSSDAPPLPLDSPSDIPLAEEARRPSLLPSHPSGDWSLPIPEEKPRGRTIRPGDPSLSPETLAAEEHARVSARVQSFAEDDLAALRVENGLMDPYFSEVREALEKQLEGAPLFKGKTSGQKLQQFAQTYVKDAERYGHSGRVGKDRDRNAHEPLTPLERLEALSQGNPAHDRMRGFLKMGEALQQHAEPEPELVVILELRQAPDGQLRSVQVVEPSGDKAFDKYVSEAVPPALARLTPPPLKTPGVHLGVQSDGIRTLWAVEGRVVYLKQVSEMKGKDAAYAAAMASLGALAGRFEETTGEVQVIDLLDPKFRCRARLLRLW